MRSTRPLQKRFFNTGNDLVIVGAIILILVAIAVPTFMRAMKKAEEAGATVDYSRLWILGGIVLVVIIVGVIYSKLSDSGYFERRKLIKLSQGILRKYEAANSDEKLILYATIYCEHPIQWVVDSAPGLLYGIGHDDDSLRRCCVETLLKCKRIFKQTDAKEKPVEALALLPKEDLQIIINFLETKASDSDDSWGKALDMVSKSMSEESDSDEEPAA